MDIWVSGGLLLSYDLPNCLLSFSGSAGQAVVSKTTAYLVTDSRYWLQATEELDDNWHMIPAGAIDGPKDWIDWLLVSYNPLHFDRLRRNLSICNRIA